FDDRDGEDRRPPRRFGDRDGEDRRPPRRFGDRDGEDRRPPRRFGDRDGEDRRPPRRDEERPDDAPRPPRPPRYDGGPRLGADKEVPIIHGRRKSWKRRDLDDNNPKPKPEDD
ncbi:MAG: hypothetical protein IKR25_00245, partial [Muribaculaceae bacterium]|nr:hypothetical protein [Muribaculaceae bacterium]